ncbi:GNAT family N-acetyltransferase [Acidobacteria bacterium AB60]|nr:GNAT family N-acetyltransferase [Acidobacteria bacterium AB60]
MRTAVLADALPVARVHVRSWQAGYCDLLPADYLASLRAEDRAARYDFTHSDLARPHTRVAAVNELIVGFATTMPCQDLALSGSGELCALYVDPDYWGSGFGGALVADARDQMTRRGFRHAVLWLLKGNARGDRFYRKDGWTPDGTRKSEIMWGVEVEDFRYSRPLP